MDNYNNESYKAESMLAESMLAEFLNLESVKTSNLTTLLIFMCLMSASIMKEFKDINASGEVNLTFDNYLDLLREFNNSVNN